MISPQTKTQLTALGRTVSESTTLEELLALLPGRIRHNGHAYVLTMEKVEPIYIFGYETEYARDYWGKDENPAEAAAQLLICANPLIIR